MKKLSIVMALTLGALAALTACGKKEADMKYLSDFSASKYVTLGEYKGINVEVGKIDVTDKDVDEYVDYILESYASPVEITDRIGAKDGDIANIDYVGKVDGVEFDGGSATGYDLTLGSGQFIEGFEAGVVGMEVGSTKDLNLKFPENYGNADLANKDAVFTVTLNKISKLTKPELNDEFVKGLGGDFNTVSEFKENVKEELIKECEAQQDDAIYSQLEAKCKELCTFTKAPSGFEDRIYETLIGSLKDSATQYGVDVGVVASYYYGVSESDYENGIRAYIEENLVPIYIMMGAIAEKEGIKVTDAKVNEEIQKAIDEYGASYTVDEYKEMLGDIESYKEYILVNEVLDFLKENAIINEN